MKQCFKCLLILPSENFYVHRGMSDGRLGKCKECAKRDVRENRAKKIEQYRLYDISRARTSSGKEKAVRVTRAWREKYPEREKAHRAVFRAVRSGRLNRLPCEVCGVTENVHGHHDDYSKPLDVRWLCPSHHARERVLTP